MAAFLLNDMLKKYQINLLTPQYIKQIEEGLLGESPGPGLLQDILVEADLLELSPSLGPLQNILGQLGHNAKSIVFELNYIDKDYQDEFSAFYSKSFRKYPPRCLRLHFFNTDIPETHDPINLGQYREAYLGFVVLRPMDLRKVGRTVLRPFTCPVDSEFITCHAKFSAHILGAELPIDGMPFLQQDSQVGACAQAALWMIARYMSSRYGYREFLPAEINHLAKTVRSLGRPLPGDRGLTIDQILDALLSMGYPAEAYTADESLDYCATHIHKAYPAVINELGQEDRTLQRHIKLADIVYRYIESGLPVLLATSNHVVVAIGHTYDHAASSSVHIKRIPAFIVHNDNAGPYLKVDIDNPKAALNFLNVNTVIVILPKEVTLRGEEAESMAVSHINRLISNERNRQSLVKKRPEYADWFRHLEYRTYLRPSVEFQKDLQDNNKDLSPDLSPDVAREMICLDYPKYIWITEISSSPLLNHKCKKDRKCLGRIIVDSTAPGRTLGLLAVHFADVLFLHDRQKPSSPPKIKYYPNSTPFKHKLWT